MEGLILFLDPLMKGPVETFKRSNGHRIKKGLLQGANNPFHTPLLVARGGIAETDFEAIMMGELQKAGVILQGLALQDDRGEVVVDECLGKSPEKVKGLSVPFDKELKGASAKQMSKQVSRIREYHGKPAEFSQGREVHKKPVNLPFFPRQKLEGVIDRRALLPEDKGFQGDGWIGDFDPPGPKALINLRGLERGTFGKPFSDQRAIIMEQAGGGHVCLRSFGIKP